MFDISPTEWTAIQLSLRVATVATLAATPLNKFMLETDCPYLAPIPYRGKRCEPAYVKEISQIVAQVKGCSLEELSNATCATAEEFFPKNGELNRYRAKA